VQEWNGQYCDACSGHALVGGLQWSWETMDKGVDRDDRDVGVNFGSLFSVSESHFLFDNNWLNVHM
jgi:hypothetical protein